MFYLTKAFAIQNMKITLNGLFRVVDLIVSPRYSVLSIKIYYFVKTIAKNKFLADLSLYELMF